MMNALISGHATSSIHILNTRQCTSRCSESRAKTHKVPVTAIEQRLVHLIYFQLGRSNVVLKSASLFGSPAQCQFLRQSKISFKQSRVPLVRAEADATGIQEAAVLPEGADLEKLVHETRSRLSAHHTDLPLGRYGRDDDGLLTWFLRDRKYNVEAAVTKVARFIKWRSEFGVDDITPVMIAREFASGKARLHAYPDVTGQPVIIVTAANHVGGKDPVPSQQLCVHLVEEALGNLPAGKEQFLGIFDLRGFGAKNADLVWVKFFVDIFFNYYPKRLSEVLFVDAPFVFQPGWAVIKPLLKSYADLVRFVSAEEVATRYFTPETVPDSFKPKA